MSSKVIEIDEKLSTLYLVLSFYESINRFIKSLGGKKLYDGHPLLSVYKVSVENNAFSKFVTQTFKKRMDAFIKSNGIVRNVNTLTDNIEKQVSKLEKNANKLEKKRLNLKI